MWSLPENLQAVVDKVKNGEVVYGFELELLAAEISKLGQGYMFD